ncbi:hypothetical protein Q8F55_004667 [Vanrija albida]|uniref:Uncharacterized protein n=1 Tax=Vanrija albida TaxID=181172 RepID=A0ABR3Q7C5_9TREE
MSTSSALSTSGSSFTIMSGPNSPSPSPSPSLAAADDILAMQAAQAGEQAAQGQHLARLTQLVADVARTAASLGEDMAEVKAAVRHEVDQSADSADRTVPAVTPADATLRDAVGALQRAVAALQDTTRAHAAAFAALRKMGAALSPALRGQFSAPVDTIPAAPATIPTGGVIGPRPLAVAASVFSDRPAPRFYGSLPASSLFGPPA